MSPEKERIYNLTLASIEEVDKILGKNKKKKRLKTGNWFFLSIKGTLNNLKNKLDSEEELDELLISQIEKMVSACARTIEDTSLFAKINEIRNYLANNDSFN